MLCFDKFVFKMSNSANNNTIYQDLEIPDAEEETFTLDILDKQMKKNQNGEIGYDSEYKKSDYICFILG